MHSVILTLIRVLVTVPFVLVLRFFLTLYHSPESRAAGLGNVECYDDTQRKDRGVVSMLDGLPASTMAELSDTLHATVKLEQLKAKLRAVC